MDENSIRTLLQQVADDLLPPSRVDIDRAIRRSRRLRPRAPLSWNGWGAPIAAMAAVALIVAATFGLRQFIFSERPSPSVHPAPATATATPRLISGPMFGWLPRGYSALGAGTSEPYLSAIGATPESGGTRLVLTVPIAGCSTLPSGEPDESASCNSWLPKLTGKAPDVNGRPAFWGQGSYLVWEYEPGAWTSLRGFEEQGGNDAGVTMDTANRKLLLKVAGNVRFSPNNPSGFPLWLRVPSSSWELDYNMGHVAWNGVYEASGVGRLRPARGESMPVDGETIAAVAKSSPDPDACPKGIGQPQSVVKDGVTWTYYPNQVLDKPDYPPSKQPGGMLCSDKPVKGLYLIVSLSIGSNAGKPLPGSGEIKTVYDVLDHLDIQGTILGK